MSDLVRHARQLEYFTIAYNSLEGLASIVAGVLAGSIALAGFGADSSIEVTSGLVLLWRLRAGQTKEQSERAEQIALRLVGICFLLLAMSEPRILVRMTRTKNTGGQGNAGKRRWALQDAKARFSELVRKAKTEGPQCVTVHGREEVVVVSVKDYRRAQGERTGQELVDMLRDSPLGDLEIERVRVRGAVRGIDL